MRKLFFTALCMVWISLSAQIPSYLPTNGLVGWWPFNGNANDESGNGNNGTALGGVALTTDRNGNSNAAFTFPGNNSSYINVNQNASFSNFTSGITVSMWYLSYANQPSPGYHPRVLELGYTGSIGFGARGFPETGISVHSNNPSFSAGYWWTGGTGSQSLNTWYHLVISVNFVSNNWVAYHNGSQVLSGINSGTLTSINYSGLNFNIGRKPITQDGAWNGKVDDIAIYNRALTQQEVTALYTATPPCQSTTFTTNLNIPSTQLPYSWNGLTFNNAGTQTATLINAAGCDSMATLNLTVTNETPSYLPTNGLVGWWPFNGNANDESGNGNNGTVNGATLTTDRFGNTSKSYRFDGLSNHISVQHSSSINCSKVTISTWFNADDFIGETNQNYLVSKREYTGWGNSYEIGLGKDPINCFNNPNCDNAIFTNYTVNNQNYVKVYSSDSALRPNEWNHFVYVHDSFNVAIYLNGKRVLFEQSPGTIPTNNTLPVWFGARPNGGRSYYNGILDDIAIYNRALTPQEISALYSGCTTQDSSSFSANGCNVYTLPWGDTINASGAYTHTYTNANGCDSIVTANITINNHEVGASVNVSGTGSYALPWGDTARNSGYYTHVYQNQNGCDSLVTYYVVINQPSSSTQPNVGINIQNPQRALHVNDAIRLEPRNTPLENPTKGDMYFDGSSNRLRYYNGSQWIDL